MFKCRVLNSVATIRQWPQTLCNHPTNVRFSVFKGFWLTKHIGWKFVSSRTLHSLITICNISSYDPIDYFFKLVLVHNISIDKIKCSRTFFSVCFKCIHGLMHETHNSIGNALFMFVALIHHQYIWSRSSLKSNIYFISVIVIMCCYIVAYCF